MSKKVLSVIDTAYRACQEEQDDAGLWFSSAVNNSGVDMAILLTGNAVNYAVKGHTTTPLSVGGGTVPHPFDPGQDIERLAEKGINFFLIREDAEERGIESEQMTGAVEAIPRSNLAKLVDSYDAIWHW